MAVRDYPLFPSENGPAPLLDHVKMRDEPRDTGIDDVRAAMAEVGAYENKHRLASELGADGIAAMQAWDHRIEQVGPYAAREAAQLYATQPRLSAPEEEERNEGDYEKSARAAFRAVAEKERRQANLPAALSGLDRIEQRHGSLGIVDTFKRWNDQLQANPQDAAPRVATEIISHINDNIGMQEAYRTLNQYQAKHQVSDAERAVMGRVIGNGVASNLAEAHAIARFETAAEIEDPYQRDVVAASRATEATAMDAAKLTVREWERAHPGARTERNGRTWELMETLLKQEKARDLDDALAKARRLR